MRMDKRYQVFVSSTYADLLDERRGVIQALMEMDCIPAGMELFPATDEDQWAFIRRVIDDCDYYILVIGGRYGSVTAEGVSYTEKEFSYAVDQGLPVLAFLHEAPDEIPVGKSEMDPVLRERLRVFRDKAQTSRLVRFWKSADQLPGLVALSLQKTIKSNPGVGWIRADSAPTEEMLIESNRILKESATLRDENAGLRDMVSKLRREAASFATPDLSNLAGLDEKITLHGTHSVPRKSNTGQTYRHDVYDWQVEITWREIFAALSPLLPSIPNEALVEAAIEKALQPEKSGVSIAQQDLYTIRIQLIAMKLVDVRRSGTTQGGVAMFWSLTPKGEKLMIELRTVRGTRTS